MQTAGVPVGHLGDNKVISGQSLSSIGKWNHRVLATLILNTFHTEIISGNY